MAEQNAKIDQLVEEGRKKEEAIAQCNLKKEQAES